MVGLRKTWKPIVWVCETNSHDMFTPISSFWCAASSETSGSGVLVGGGVAVRVAVGVTVGVSVGMMTVGVGVAVLLLIGVDV